MLHRQITIKHLASLQFRNDGKHIAFQTLKPFRKLIREPVLTQYIRIHIGRRYEKKRYTTTRLYPAGFPAFHVLSGKFQGTPGGRQLCLQRPVGPETILQLIIMLQAGQVFSFRLIVDKTGTQHQQYLFLIILLRQLQNPVIFAQMVRVRHIGRKGTTAIPDTVPILHPKATHRLQQVRELFFREILHLVPEYAYIRASRTDCRAVQ